MYHSYILVQYKQDTKILGIGDSSEVLFDTVLGKEKEIPISEINCAWIVKDSGLVSVSDKEELKKYINSYLEIKWAQSHE